MTENCENRELYKLLVFHIVYIYVVVNYCICN